MVTKWTPTESRVLEEVRRWRRQVYEADRGSSEVERLRRVHELAQRLGLTTIQRDEPRAPDSVA